MTLTEIVREKSKTRLYRVTLVITIITIVMLPVLTGAPSFLNAGTEPDPDRIVFSKETNNPFALIKAKKVYQSYLKSLGLEKKAVNIDPGTGYARYLPLDKKKPERFLGYSILGELDVSCPPLGCETLVFENTGGNNWRMVFHTYQHNMWMDKNPQPNGIRDIFTQSNYLDPGFGAGGDLYRWRWDDENKKYENTGIYQERDLIKPEWQ